MNLTALDHSATLALNFDGGVVVDRLMWLISEKLTWAPLYLLLLWLTYRRWGWRYMVVILGALVGGFVVWLIQKLGNKFKASNL